MMGFIFWIEIQVSVTVRPGTSRRYTSHFIFWERKLVFATAKPIIGRRYILDFIFWIGKQVSATVQASGICCAIYFR